MFGEGNGNPLQYSCLENTMERGAWQATVHGVAKSRTRLKRLNTHKKKVDACNNMDITGKFTLWGGPKMVAE